MIIAGQKLPVLVRMDTTDVHFQLTGSRFFGGARPDSDWDFFAADTAENRDILFGLGFELDYYHEYKDAEVVFQHYGENIHVQLVKDVHAKIDAQKLLLPFLKYLPKAQHKKMWTAALIEVARRSVEK